MTLDTLIAEMAAWLATLPPEFLFLLALPFLVAAAGMAVHREPAASSAASLLSRCGIPAGIAAALALFATGTS